MCLSDLGVPALPIPYTSRMSCTCQLTWPDVREVCAGAGSVGRDGEGSEHAAGWHLTLAARCWPTLVVGIDILAARCMLIVGPGVLVVVAAIPHSLSSFPS